MKICPQCNEKYDEDVSFCLTDGTVLVSESLHEITATQPDEETIVIKNPETSNKPQGASSFTKGVLGLLIFALLFGGIGFAYWQMGKKSFASHQIPNKITKEEMELLIKDFNPMQKKQLEETPEQKKELVDNIKELLAIANQAQKDGMTNDPSIQQELQGIEESVTATTYDQKINKAKGQVPPFSNITEDQVKKYWDATDDQVGILDKIGLGSNTKSGREKEFKTFIDNKIALARKNKQLPEGQNPSEEELKQAREAYAKIKITNQEAQKKLNSIGSLPAAEKKDWEDFKKKNDLQIKLQKAQFLASNYFQNVLSKKLEVTDADIDAYIKKNPALTNTEEKKKKAEEVLQKVKDGGDFAALAKENSDDPGSKDKGGLYENVGKGQFAPEFEVAALTLKPGEIAPEVVSTNFGFHIIKLIKKGETKDAEGKTAETYDVRHILISTMVKDPDNPAAREMPVKDFVKAKLNKERQEKSLEEIKKNNPVEVAENFEIPKVTDEEIKQMEEAQKKQLEQMQEMQKGMPQPNGDPKTEPKKPEDKPKE